ncbi:hypothetical protein Hhaem_14910 [Haemophilus haemolyticus]|uniref:YadA-like family protein n=1 Tax=Haemophilus haemolyticus TaxID=726 RepID=UPI001CC45F77|nr:YadA-like family protein [Haemophilus haemolyticus]BCL67778.1 hypothetical protein Hhaem_14910 [Haemophilus haemolyticus]
MGTGNYFRVTTTNVGEAEDLEHYRGCPDGNVDSACPDTEMNIGVLDTDSAPEEDTSDNSRLVLEGNKGIRLTRKNDAHTAHKITFDASVEAADGSGAISIEQPVEGDKAGHTIIKSVIKSGSPDKIQVTSDKGETTISWIGGDTAGGATGDKGPQGDKGLQGDKGDKGATGDKGEKGDAGRRVIGSNGITATVDSVNDTLTIAAETGTITAGETPSVTTADANKLAKAGEVAEAIKTAKNAVESRLSGNMDKLNHRIDKVGKRADAGTASAIATANLLQSYRPGLSAATAAVGEYRGQSAVAVGYSRLSDNGKYGVKLSLGANTQGNVDAGAGVAYFW